jgi:nitrogenase molybdenum-iron protein alpha/beta subunit
MSQDRADDFTERQNYPFMVGVYLAVNAISDAFLLVDGPDCAHMKTQYVQGNHDWLSTLTDISGFHRVANTALHPFQMARSREANLVDRLARMAAHPPAGVVMVTPMPMAAITGVDYERLARQAAANGGTTPVVSIPGRSLSGDWLSGYAAALSSLAKHIGDPAPEPGCVALVGYLMDRNEGDHRANLRDIEELLRGLDLELVSVWLSGKRFEDLRAVRRASLIVSLPYGRRAARLLSRRLGVPVLETGLPFGLDGTARWVREVARATGREKLADRLIERELDRVIPPLEWVVPVVFLHRTVSFIGDPFFLEGFLDLTTELGCRHGPMMVTARADHAPALAERADALRLVFEPTRKQMMEHLEPIHHNEVDLVVTNSTGSHLMGGSTPVMEIGYPSFFTHALYARPFLGFDGALAFIDSMGNALRRIDLMRMHQYRSGERPGER